MIDYLRRKQTRLKASQEFRRDMEQKLKDEAAADDEIWRKEWEKALYETAMERVRERVGEETFRIFKRYVLERDSAQDVANETSLDANAIYAVKHRVLKYLRNEVEKIRNNEEV